MSARWRSCAHHAEGIIEIQGKCRVHDPWRYLVMVECSCFASRGSSGGSNPIGSTKKLSALFPLSLVALRGFRAGGHSGAIRADFAARAARRASLAATHSLASAMSASLGTAGGGAAIRAGCGATGAAIRACEATDGGVPGCSGRPERGVATPAGLLSSTFRRSAPTRSCVRNSFARTHVAASTSGFGLGGGAPPAARSISTCSYVNFLPRPPGGRTGGASRPVPTQ